MSLPVRSLENGVLRLEYLADSGPRIVSLRVKGSPGNLLGEVPTIKIDTPNGVFSLIGGHRLWHSPEAFPRTYIPDDSPPAEDAVENGVRLAQPVEKQTGIQKTMEIRLPREEPVVIVDHHLTNHGIWPVELAPWAITILPLGGVAVLPFQSPGTARDGMLPDRSLVLWPYTDIHDPRLVLGNDLILIRAEPGVPAVKIGCLNRQGWAGYYRDGVFLCKRFDPLLTHPHPDYGCNTECYCKDQFLELETLGPLTHLEPGETVSHRERWEITAGLTDPQTPDGIRAIVTNLSLRRNGKKINDRG